jgi:hypothetical protein
VTCVRARNPCKAHRDRVYAPYGAGVRKPLPTRGFARVAPTRLFGMGLTTLCGLGPYLPEMWGPLAAASRRPPQHERRNSDPPRQQAVPAREPAKQVRRSNASHLPSFGSRAYWSPLTATMAMPTKPAAIAPATRPAEMMSRRVCDGESRERFALWGSQNQCLACKSAISWGEDRILTPHRPGSTRRAPRCECHTRPGCARADMPQVRSIIRAGRPVDRFGLGSCSACRGPGR